MATVLTLHVPKITSKERKRRVLCLSQWKKKSSLYVYCCCIFSGKQKKGENTMMSGPISLWRIRLSSKKLEAQMFVRSCRWSCCRNPTFMNLSSYFACFNGFSNVFQNQTAAKFAIIPDWSISAIKTSTINQVFIPTKLHIWGMFAEKNVAANVVKFWILYTSSRRLYDV